MRKRIVLQFPGFGGYVPGIFKDWDAGRSDMQETLHVIDRIALQYDLEPISSILTEEGSPSLNEISATPTRVHLATFATSLCIYRALDIPDHITPVHLGHSTGEFAALTVAGCLSVQDAAKIICERDPGSTEGDYLGGLTVLRISSRRAEHLCRAIGEPSLQVALKNAPDQTVISGTIDALEAVERLASAAYIESTRLLVKYLHHNPGLHPVAQRLAIQTSSLKIQNPTRRIYSPILSRYVESAADARELIDRHLTDSVHYLEAIRELYDYEDVRVFMEVGPNSLLSEMTEASLPANAEIIRPPIDSRSINNVIQALQGKLNEIIQHDPGNATFKKQSVGVFRDNSPGGSPAAPESSQDKKGSENTKNLTRDEVIDYMAELLVSDLGYPRDVITPEANLEADLGVQSIKRTEIFVKTLDRYSLATPPATVRLRDFATLGQLADLLQQIADHG